MKKAMILISGMPGLGKTTLANWLSQKMRTPLVCYDHIKAKTIDLARAGGAVDDEQLRLFAQMPMGMFWFNCEAVMQTGCLLIAEYFFSDYAKVTLDALTAKYGYEVIQIHLDSSVETACQRFNERGQKESVEWRPGHIPLEQFAKGVEQNRDFRYGRRMIEVDASDFAQVDYGDIAAELDEHLTEVLYGK